MTTITYQMTDTATGLIVDVTLTENGDGTLTVDLTVDPTTGVIGDLNAIYFDLADGFEGLLDGMSATGIDVTGERYAEDKVTKIDNFTNVNGEVVQELGKFDLGVQLGTQGISQDDIQSTSFILSHESADLTLDMFYAQDSAIRLTSVGDVDGGREDSLKIGGEVPPEPEGPENIANDDVMRVSENENYNAPFPDVMNIDGFTADDQLIDNDTSDGGAYLGTVTAMNGIDLDTVADTFEFVGSNGGTLVMNDQGFIDFSAADIDLAEGEEIVTYFTYEIEGGDTATLAVTVFGEADDTGGGGGESEGGGDDGTTDPDLPPIDDPFGFF